VEKIPSGGHPLRAEIVDKVLYVVFRVSARIGLPPEDPKAKPKPKPKR
jgi:hypothetical protein